MRLHRPPRLRAALILALLALSLALPVAAADSRAPFEARWYLHHQRLVDVGGRRLNLFCVGMGSPTVILDAGLGDSDASFRMVQAPLSHTTRTCSFDRAGMGFSNPGPFPRDAAAMTDDLHALLHRAGVPPPYVLVGHSIAGLYVRLYADRYPTEVAGMVLIDPSFPFQSRTFQAIAPALMRYLSSAMTVEHNVCIPAAESGALRSSADVQAECGLRTPAALHRECVTSTPADCAIATFENDVEMVRPEYWRDIVSESEMFETRSSQEVTREQRSYGSMPLVVLTAADTVAQAPFTTARERRALWKAWKAAHDRIAALSSRGVDVVVAGSGHYVQYDRPRAVVSAVDEVVREVRAAQLP